MAELSTERVVKEFEDELVKAFALYRAAMRVLATNDGEPSVKEFLDVQRTGSDYFNLAEQFAYRLELTDAKDQGGYITGFAETCHTILDAYLDYRETLQGYASKLSIELAPPSTGSYAALQRILVSYLPAEAKTLAKRFRDASLPVRGFEVKPARNRMRPTTIPALLGVLALIIMLIFSLLVPNPTPWQQFVWRGGFMSLAISACATALFGTVNLKFKSKGPGIQLVVTATGTMAILLIVYLVNPPSV